MLFAHGIARRFTPILRCLAAIVSCAYNVSKYLAHVLGIFHRMSEVIHNDHHTVAESTTEKILSRHDETKKYVQDMLCVYLVHIWDIPDGDNIFVHRK